MWHIYCLNLVPIHIIFSSLFTLNGNKMIFQMASMKQEKDARIIVLALAAPVTKFKPPQTRKRNKASSSNHAKSKRASTDGPSGMWSWIFVIECFILAKNKKGKKEKKRESIYIASSFHKTKTIFFFFYPFFNSIDSENWKLLIKWYNTFSRYHQAEGINNICSWQRPNYGGSNW